MPSTADEPTLEQALADPEQAFDHPDDVLAAKHLSIDQKALILERWREESRSRMRAAKEERYAGKPNHLSALERAMETLGRELQDGR